MAPTDLHSRSYMVMLDEGVAAKARIVICEVERTKFEVKRFCVWAYCGYPAEVEDIRDQLNGQVERKLRQHTMQLMVDENLWSDDEATGAAEDDGLGV